MNHWLAIAVGGALGAMARYAVAMGATRLAGNGFPWGTLVANVVGCLLLGCLAEWALHSEALSPWMQKGLGIGVLGALTTFSTFAHDTFRLAEEGRMAHAAGNLGLNLALGFTAVCLGVWLMRRIVAL